MTTNDITDIVTKQKEIDDKSLAQAKEIVDGQNIESLEEAKLFVRNWIVTALQYCRNADYYRGDRDRVEAEAADLRVRLQKAHGALHCLKNGDHIANPDEVIRQTTPPSEAGLAMLMERRELQDKVKRLEEEIRILHQPFDIQGNPIVNCECCDAAVRVTAAKLDVEDNVWLCNLCAEELRREALCSTPCTP